MLEQLEHIETGQLEFLARQVVEGFVTGMHKSPFHGFSVEFAEHRSYNQGESVKNIDWKLFARTDKLYVKEYDEETNLRCMVLFDVSKSMYFPEKQSKVQVAALTAATILELLRKQRDASGLTMFGGSILEMTPIRSNGSHYRHLFNRLEHYLKNQVDEPATDIAQTLHLIAEKVHRRSLIVLFSDLFTDAESNESLFDALRHLKFNKHEVIIFNILDHKLERTFEWSNRPSRFVDVETGESIKLQPAEIKKIYNERMEAFRSEVKLKCAQYGVDWVDVDAQSHPTKFLIPFLMKRNRMRV